MAPIINSMDKRIAVSNNKNKPQQIIIKSVFAGVIGYWIFLSTLITTYWFTYKLFSLDSARISNTDFIISSVGFVTLFAAYFIIGRKQN